MFRGPGCDRPSRSARTSQRPGAGDGAGDGRRRSRRQVVKAAIVKGHSLVGEGAAFTPAGERVLWNSTSGVGHAFCSCGERSEALLSAAARKRWHRQHKTDVSCDHETSCCAEHHSHTVPHRDCILR